MSQFSIIRAEDTPVYEPDGHKGTMNRRLLRTDRVEVILGVISHGGGSEDHIHKELDQYVYVISGRGKIEQNGKWVEVGPDSLFYFPKGVLHGGMEITGPDPLKLLIIYAPPLSKG
jgi:quercetin dioxygenase-like cupin family protein